MRWSRVFVFLLIAGLLGLTATISERVGAQAPQPAVGQPGPVQPAPSSEVSPVTPRGPIRLTATPPKIASPEPVANTSSATARYVEGVSLWRVQ